MVSNLSSVVQTSLRVIKNLRDRLSYEYFGPTTIHLKIELYQLMCMTLLTVANLQGLYKDSFGLSGDFIYIFFVSLWLSRHLIARWLCLWDVSTSRHPTVRGLLSCLLTSHIYAGQTFDKPSRMVVSKYFGNPTNQSKQLSLVDVVPTSVLYLLQLVKMRIYYPICFLLKIDLGLMRLPLPEFIVSALHATTGVRNAANGLLQYAYSSWASISPSLATVIFSSTWLFYVVKLFQLCFGSSRFARSDAGLAKDEGEATKPYGMYQPFVAPQWSTVFLIISAFGTILSLIYFGRVIDAMPDHIARGNVIQDVRYKNRTSAVTSKSTKRRDNQDSTSGWNEKSRFSSNMFDLRITSFICRMFECVFLCGLLPRTTFICRATGHCAPGAELWQLTKALYPAGITTPLRRDISFALDTMASDIISAFYCVMGIVVMLFNLQMAQSALLSKSYLSLLAYLSIEWELVDATTADVPIATLAAWDSRKKYKKGDLVLYPPMGHRQLVYRAISSAPEGNPLNVDVKNQHKVFAKELGPPASSSVMRRAAYTELMLIVYHSMLYSVLKGVFGYSAAGLATAIMAHTVAAYALSTLGAANYGEMSRLSEEISQVR
ncbi:hypothetical protein MPSEU_000302400 [Mayamaea pseudoterrestris]|nr:hypothetical protein MPSEU_000302400 [Mayamaea pseudoterrestris]